jgi:hypothetical protein
LVSASAFAGLNLSLTADLSAGSEAAEFRFPERWRCGATESEVELIAGSWTLNSDPASPTMFRRVTAFSGTDGRREPERVPLR